MSLKLKEDALGEPLKQQLQSQDESILRKQKSQDVAKSKNS